MKANVRVLFCVLFSVSLAYAAPQAGISTGEIRGIVKDPSGALVPSATIVLTNEKTGQSNSVTTNEVGSYRALLLRPDFYRVRVQQAGFQAEDRAIELTVGETAVIDFQLALGTIKGPEVTVLSESPL